MPSEDHHVHHGHGHHDHGAPGHSHAPADFGRAFAVGIALNLGFVLAETVAGLMSGSVALLADAGHNFSDVLGLAVAWLASVMVKTAPSHRFSYGMRGTSILAALFNAVFLLVAVGAISWEAIRRFAEPAPVAGTTVMIVAAIGIVINGATALMFMRGSRDDINLRGAYLHMAADALVSLGVLCAGFGILLTGWAWIDPVMSLVIAAVIVWGTWGLLRESLGMAIAAVPPHLDPVEVRGLLLAQPGVASLHDLHIWPISTTETALTCHLVMPAGSPGDRFLHDLARTLQDRFRIAHPTFQIETDPRACALAPDHLV